MNRRSLLFISILCFSLVACKSQVSQCEYPQGTPLPLITPPGLLATPTPGEAPAALEMQINGSTVWVDKVVEGPLCNDTWSGTVYVTCNVQVYPWQEQPLFLKDCDLQIAPDTIVYVAYHNDAVYYNGCSCHTEITSEP
jgi:hypothetical protein